MAILPLAQGLLQLRSGLQTATQSVALNSSSPVVLRVPTPLPSVDPETELCAAGTCTHVMWTKDMTDGCKWGFHPGNRWGVDNAVCFQSLVCDQTRGALQNKD